jgi:hypothetical protein
MGVIVTRNQPQGLHRVNRGNPIAKNLVFAYTPGAGVFTPESLHPAIPTLTGTITSKIRKTGRSINIDAGGSYLVLPSFSDENVTGAITILSISRHHYSGGDGAIVSKNNGSGDSADPTPFIFGRSSGNGGVLLARSNSGGFRVWSGGSDAFSLDTDVTVAATQGADVSVAPLFYINGKLDAVAPVNNFSGAAIGSAGSNAASIKLGNRGDGGTQFYGDIYGVFVWNRVLSAAEIAAVTANPWQLFQAPQRTLFAVSAPTGDATAMPSGVSATASVGAATGAGSANTSPAGVSATASVGTAVASGSTVVNGTATPAGVSATASTGTASASGAATVSATGVASTAAVGTAVAGGGANASPAGVSASASVGAPAASGNASAQPVGVSAIASVGAAAVSGAANVAASGVSATASVGTATATGAGAGVAMPSGVSASASVGTVAATGSASATPAGVAATASVGTASASGTAPVHGTAAPAGVSALASVGTASVSAGANANPAGVSVLASIGQPIATGEIHINGTALPAGVIAYAYVGTATATGGGIFTRAPAGSGYAPRRNEQQSRPRSGNTTRPSNTQRNYR